MSDRQESHLTHAEAGLVALLSCIVQTLGESNDAFQHTYLKNLEDTYSKVRDSEMFGVAGLEALTLMRDLLKK